MRQNYPEKLTKVRQALKKAEAVLIGGGAGLSAAAGLTYGGRRFSSHFSDFIKKYRLTDMYSAGFYPFPTQEEKWAYWSRHIKVNRYDPVPGQVYLDLLNLVKRKDYFVITTNVDAQFYKSGFAHDKIFPIQGDYGMLQCAKACHKGLYNNEKMILKMVSEQNNCRIPSRLIPKCPVCLGPMEPNIRKNAFFIEDDAWHRAGNRYEQFLNSLGNKPLVLFELGVGYNTPIIIKTPFERITTQHPKATLIRINKDYPEISRMNQAKTIAFDQDIGEIIPAI